MMSRNESLVCAAIFSVLVIGITVSVSAEPITLVNHSFEDPLWYNVEDGWDLEDGASLEIPGWESDGLSFDYSGKGWAWHSSGFDGSYWGFIRGIDPSCYQLTDHVISSAEGYTVTLVAKNLAFEDPTGAELSVSLYYDDNGARVTMDTEVITNMNPMESGTPDDAPLLEYILNFDASPAGAGKLLGLELANTGGAQSLAGFDNIRMETYSREGPILIYPIDEENLNNYFPTLLWNDPLLYEPGLYYIYLDPNLANVAAVSKMVNPDPGSPLHINVSQSGSDPNEYTIPGNKELAHGQRFYWKVEAQRSYPGEDPNYFSSGVATFTTIPDEPIITQHPQNMTVPKDTDGVFTVVAVNADQYHWYKVQTGDDPEVGEPNIPTLTINVQKEDEGFYYCVCSNAKGSISTDIARLMVQRRVALWNFDDQNISSDVVDPNEEDYFPATYLDPNDSTPDPEFANSNPGPSPAGGYYIIFDGDTPESEGNDFGEAILAEPNEFFNFYPQGVTASAWVQVTGTGASGWTAAVSKHAPVWIGWVLQQNNNHGVFTTRQASGDVTSSTGIDLGGINEDIGDNWHLLTGTYGNVDEDEAIESRIYVDGNLEAEAESTAVMQPHAFPLLIGAETSAGFSPWNGLIDYVEIYNYPLSRFTVAKKYTDMVPGAKICIEDVEGITDDMDFNDDCIVDIKDLHMFVTDWLDCNIVPDCITTEP